MKLINYISSFAVLLTVSTTICTAANPAKSEAVFNKIVKEYTLNTDGSTQTRYIKELTLHSFPSMNSIYGETFIVYNPNYQKISFEEAKTTQVDGTVIPVPVNAFNEVLLRAAADAPAYNDAKEMVVTHTGLEIGAKISLAYTITSTPAGPRYLDIAEIVQELSPVEQYLVKVTVPEGTPVNYLFTGGNAKPTITNDSGKTIYTWTFQSVPAASREQFQPSVAGYKPYLTFTTLPSQESVLKLVKENFVTKTNNISDNIISQKTSELIQNTNTPQDKIKTIQHFLTSSIDNNALTLSETGGRIRPPQAVMESAYGTSAEKTLLLKQMLETVGIKSDIVLLYPAGIINKAVAGLAAVKAIGLVTEYEGASYYLPSNSEVQKPLKELANNYDICRLSDKGFEIVKQDVEKVKINYSVDTLSTTTSGVWLEDEYMKIVLDKDNTKGVDSFEMTNLISERKSPLSTPYPIEETINYVISLGEEIELVTLPSEVHISNKAGKLDLSIKKESNQLTVHKYINFDKSIFTPEEYSDFRRIMQEWNNPNFGTVVVRKISR